jgi:vanillate O-demethylase ferredoxin subunit
LCAVDVLECDSPLDHRDVFFSEAEKAAGTRLCTCVSRPTGGTIVIDTDYRGRDAQMGS